MSLGVDVRHGSSSGPLVGRRFLMLSRAFDHSFYQQRVSWCVAGWQGSSADPLVVSRFLCLTGIGLVLSVGYVMCPVVCILLNQEQLVVQSLHPVGGHEWLADGRAGPSCIMAWRQRSTHQLHPPSWGTCLTGRSSSLRAHLLVVASHPSRGQVTFIRWQGGRYKGRVIYMYACTC